jgi:hypothetical protein
MTALIGILRAWNFTVYVISASNFITVRTVAEEWLDIPAARAFGIACSTIRQPHPETGRPIDVLSGDLIEPVPVATGKADLYSQRIGDIAPRLTAGDSLLDIPMLALTESRGIILWAGDSEPVLQRLLPHPEILFRIEKPRPRG